MGSKCDLSLMVNEQSWFLISRMQYAVRDANQSGKIMKCTLSVAPLQTF